MAVVTDFEYRLATMAQEQVMRGEYNDAIVSYTTLMGARPDDPDVCYYRGIVHFKKGDFYKAKADFEKTLQLNPSYSDAQDLLRLANNELR